MGDAAQLMRLLQHRFEHRLEVTGRSVDDLEDFGSCGLLLQRLVCLSDESSIPHRDDRLRREVLQQTYLLLGEWPDFLPIGRDGSQRDAVFAQWCDNDAARTS